MLLRYSNALGEVSLPVSAESADRYLKQSWSKAICFDWLGLEEGYRDKLKFWRFRKSFVAEVRSTFAVRFGRLPTTLP